MNSEVETVVAVLDNSHCEVEDGLAEQVTAIEYKAESLVVASDKEYAEAGAFGRMLKEKMAEVTEFFAPMKKTAHEAHKQICDREKKMLSPLKKAEAIIKKSMGEYALKKEEARKKAEEEARRLAREEADRKLAECIAAEKAGDEKTARVAIIDAQMADEAARSITIDSGKPTAEGVSTYVDWEIETVDEETVPVAISGITIRPVDTGAVMRLIRASKGEIVIPGIKYKKVMKTSFRR